MRITDVTVTLFAWNDMPAINYGFTLRPGGERPPHDLGLVTIHTDEGIEGHAFLGKTIDPGSSDAGGVVRYLKPILVGRDPFRREEIYQLLWRQGRLATIRAIGAVDVALWDLLGKALDMPVHRLLGTYRDRIPVYCSSDHLPSPAAYAEEAAAFKARGWAGYKIHPNGQWREDIAICRAVRDAVGDEFTVMLDSVFLYDYPAALRVGRAVEEMGFHWYEDPLSDQDIVNYVKLKQVLRIPILATERPAATPDSYAIWIKAGATDYLRGDVAIKGGITAMMKTAHLAEAFRMNYEVHVGGNALNNLANLHVEMAIRNCEFHEIIMPEGASDYGVLETPQVDAEGFIHAPAGPGLGAAIDFDLIRRNTILLLR